MTFIAENAALVAVNDKGCTHALSVILWTRLSLCASLNRHKVAASGKTYFVHFLHLLYYIISMQLKHLLHSVNVRRSDFEYYRTTIDETYNGNKYIPQFDVA